MPKGGSSSRAGMERWSSPGSGSDSSGLRRWLARHARDRSRVGIDRGRRGALLARGVARREAFERDRGEHGLEILGALGAIVDALFQALHDDLIELLGDVEIGSPL